MPEQSQPKEIAIIGGGLAGCLTALMLAKERVVHPDKTTSPKYNITIIEAQSTVLNGASVVASRLHLGGEYPLDEVTANDCLKGAVIWKLLMPKGIYTPTPPMKFLIAQETQEEGKLTETMYKQAYDKIKHNYGIAITKIKYTAGRRTEQKETEQKLFGPKEGLFKDLDPKDYADYNQGETEIAAGFRSQELGLNVPKYLAMIQHELEAQKNITILTKHKVNENGVYGSLKNKFIIHCQNGTIKEHDGQHKKFDQVIMSAWRGNPAITPHLDKKKPVTVFKRAMLLVDLPEGWKTPPAFIMLGQNGGMLAPYNDKIAICYLPTEEAAYRKAFRLTEANGSLPKTWDRLSKDDRKEWTDRYFALLKKRFPILESAKNPRLLIRDTLSFQQDLTMRRDETVTEIKAPVMRVILHTQQEPEVVMTQAHMQHMEADPYESPLEIKPGVLTIYPTKATYSVRAAVQAAALVNERSEYPERSTLVALEEDTLDLILRKPSFSLADMQELDPIKDKTYFEKFFKKHRDLAGGWKILENTWPFQEIPNGTQPWVDRSQGKGWGLNPI